MFFFIKVVKNATNLALVTEEKDRRSNKKWKEIGKLTPTSWCKALSINTINLEVN